MSNIFKYETAEEAKKAIMSVILSKDWKNTLCKDKNGNEIEYYFDRRAIAKIAQTVPAGMFESQEVCDNLLLNCLLDNVDAIAKFVAGRGPLKSITTEYDNVVGYVVQFVSDTQVTQTPCYQINMMISRNDKSVAGFYVSDFSPVL